MNNEEFERIFGHDPADLERRYLDDFKWLRDALNNYNTSPVFNVIEEEEPKRNRNGANETIA